jgi:hypothetical protein
MDKVIKEFNNKNLIYQLGYNPWRNKAFLRIEIYKDEELFSGGGRSDGTYGGLFYFFTDYSSSDFSGYANTIKEMFTQLRQYHEIPEYIEKEYEDLFLLYKLNDFNKF